MNKGKGMTITRGPSGAKVGPYGSKKNVQVLRGIILPPFKEMVLEPETVDDQEVFFVYHEHLLKKLETMGERDPVSKIEQFIEHGYLVRRTTAPNAISYYIFKYKSHGKEFQRKHPKDKAA